MKTFSLEIDTPIKVINEESVKYLRCPGIDGSFGVMHKHRNGVFALETGEVKIETNNVDDEITKIAGPQLVVPIMNARYTLNAANARWGSLYDALYGTNVIEGKIDKNWDQNRAVQVIKYVRNFFDENFPLEKSSWKKFSRQQVWQKI